MAPTDDVTTTIRTRVDASIKTSTLVAQLTSHFTPTPGDFVLREELHTIALQRQPQDSFSVGRFESPGAYQDFMDIGRVLFIPAGVPLHIKTDGSLTHTFRCFFRTEQLSALIGSRDYLDLSRLHNCLNIKSPPIRSLLLRMAQEIETPGLASEILLDALGQTLKIELARYLTQSASYMDPRRGGLTRSAYRKIIERIEAPTPPPNLSELAQLAGMSVRQLTRAFRQTTGMSVTEMVDEVRFKRAVSLLKANALSISTIAVQLGFLSNAAFAKAFRRWSGQSPSQFKASPDAAAEHPPRLRANVP